MRPFLHWYTDTNMTVIVQFTDKQVSWLVGLKILQPSQKSKTSNGYLARSSSLTVAAPLRLFPGFPIIPLHVKMTYPQGTLTRFLFL